MDITKSEYIRSRIVPSCKNQTEIHYMAITSTHAVYPSVPSTLTLPYPLYHPKSYCTLDHLNQPKPICTNGAHKSLKFDQKIEFFHKDSLGNNI